MTLGTEKRRISLAAESLKRAKVTTFDVTVVPHHGKCGGEVAVLGTRLLSVSAHGCCLLNLKEGEEQKEMLEAKDDEEKEIEMDGEVEERATRRVHET